MTARALIWRLFELRSWLALLAVLAVSILAGCAKEGTAARVVGDTVYLPERSSLLSFRRVTSDQLPFVRFDGQYPAVWPEAAMLPPDSYLARGSQLEGKQEWYGYHASFDGICRGTPESVVADWNARIAAAGWEVNYSLNDQGANFPSGIVDGDVFLAARLPGSINAQCSMNVAVYRHRYMDGWVHFTGGVDISAGYLPAESRANLPPGPTNQAGQAE